MIFQDRRDAGIKLAHSLIPHRGPDTVVYALPRGGVVVAAEVARTLKAPLDLIIVRKIGHPRASEYAIAAVAEDGQTIESIPEVTGIDREWFIREVQVQQDEARRRRDLYLRGRRAVPATAKVAIIVDDGIATGLTMILAIQEVRIQNPREIVVAVPVAPADTIEKIRALADSVVILQVPEIFHATGEFYQNFEQVSDADVIGILTSVNNIAHPL